MKIVAVVDCPTLFLSCCSYVLQTDGQSLTSVFFLVQVDIQIKINTAMKQPVARMDSTATTPGADAEDSEFDKDAIVTEKVSQEVLDQLKPRMKGKRFQQWPMKKADSDLSGLCSIM